MGRLARELRAAIDAARSAGAIIRGHYATGVGVQKKRSGSPVTAADLEANASIAAAIRGAFPGDGWLSEESADSAERLQRRRVWIVDPLDGTKEFIERVPEFCVCIALADGGRPVLGVSYNPVRDELFTGVVGEGAAFNGAPSHVSAATDLRAARVLASRSEDARGEWDAFKPHLRVVLTGSVAYKLALISAGRGDATFSLTPKNEWDICAGVALIEAAGGRVTDPRGGALRFNQACTRLPGLIATNAALHDSLTDLVRRTAAP